MSIGTLWTVDAQPSGKAIKAIADYCGLKLDIGQNYTHFETNLTDAFRAKFASGKIPAFETSSGYHLFEGRAIARYIAEKSPKSKLFGSTTEDSGLVEQWLSFFDSEITHPITTAITICRAHNSRYNLPYNKPIETFFRERGMKSFEILEKHLHSQTFLVGERITLADFHAVASLQGGFRTVLDAAWRDSHPNVVRYFHTMANQPSVKPHLGETEFCEKAVQYVPPAKPAKEAKPAAAPAPKKEEKPKPKKQEDDEEEDDIPRDEPKAKNPLDSLPKSDFNLEDWKRAYSNMDTRGAGGSLEWFYNKFDKEGFSVWKVDFKYNNELTQVFMSSNQIGGFFNRLEASRKYLFGSVGVLGTANNSAISGVFVCRGKDIKPVVEVAPDFESYNYTALDLGNSKDKAFFEGAMAWDLEEGNLKWADGKAFK